MKKEAQTTSSVQSLYVDETGKPFTVSDVVKGYRPKGKYKTYSLSNIIQREATGK